MNPLRALMYQRWTHVLHEIQNRFRISAQEWDMLQRIRQGEMFVLPAEFVRVATPDEQIWVNLDLVDLSICLWKDNQYTDFGGARTLLNFGNGLNESCCVALIDFLLEQYRGKRLHWVETENLNIIKNTWALPQTEEPAAPQGQWQYYALSSGKKQWMH